MKIDGSIFTDHKFVLIKSSRVQIKLFYCRGFHYNNWINGNKLLIKNVGRIIKDSDNLS